MPQISLIATSKNFSIPPFHLSMLENRQLHSIVHLALSFYDVNIAQGCFGLFLILSSDISHNLMHGAVENLNFYSLKKHTVTTVTNVSDKFIAN